MAGQGSLPARRKLLSAYLCRPTLLGAGAGFALLAQAPRLRAAVAIATAARILTNFTISFPSFPGMLPSRECGTSARCDNIFSSVPAHLRKLQLQRIEQVRRAL